MSGSGLRVVGCLVAAIAGACGPSARGRAPSERPESAPVTTAPRATARDAAAPDAAAHSGPHPDAARAVCELLDRRAVIAAEEADATAEESAAADGTPTFLDQLAAEAQAELDRDGPDVEGGVASGLPDPRIERCIRSHGTRLDAAPPPPPPPPPRGRR